MSERILKALMQLFAIVANVGRDDSNSREFVRQFLDEQLNKLKVDFRRTLGRYPKHAI